MAVVGKYDARMTLNTTSLKKKMLLQMAAEDGITDSEILRRAVDEFLERHNGSTASAAQD